MTSLKSDEIVSVSVGIDTKNLGFELYKRRKDSITSDWKECGVFHKKKDAIESFYEGCANNAGKKIQYDYKVVKVVRDTWVEGLANDPSVQSFCKTVENHINSSLDCYNKE